MKSSSKQQASACRALLLGSSALAGFLYAQPSFAQVSDPVQTSNPNPDQVDEDAVQDTIIVRGIRGSLQSALAEKRAADNLKEIIEAEDIGKLPDQNLADVLENITGVQLDRTVGIGSAVQIRGSDLNRIEINGNSTVGNDGQRGGISFEDLPASLIASVEVTKVPDARTIEGSVGGTINLRTFRGLSLKEPLLSARVLGEHSDLSQSVQPRISGSIGNRFDTGLGDLGIIISGGYNKQDVSSFNPRVDRDQADTLLVDGVQTVLLRPNFLQQTVNNIEFENFSITGSAEWAPRDDLKIFFDGTFTTQERAQQGNTLLFAGLGAGAVLNGNPGTVITGLETLDLGSVDTPDGNVVLGEVLAVQTGIFDIGQAGNGNVDPNLRTRTDTNSRITDTFVLSGGGEWKRDRLTVRAEGLYSSSESERPDVRTVLDFVNPNSPTQIGGGPQDNGTPVEVDLTDGRLAFGVAQGLASSPTTAQLLDPANYFLNNFRQDLDLNDNTEVAFRADVGYDTADILPFFSSVDVGFRWNENTSDASEARDAQAFLFSASRPSAALFSEIIAAGPDNFDDADGRTLFVPDFLVVDPSISFNDPEAVIAILSALPGVNNFDGDPNIVQASFFDVEEETFALYAQANYDTELAGIPIRGNLGLRWISTDLSSTGFALGAGNDTEIVTDSSYDFFLPRFNFVAQPADDFLVRFGVARDISRPNFNDLSVTANFPGVADNPVGIGNPDVLPEDVWSFDISGEYYFSQAGFLSVGFFYKDRDNVIVTQLEETLGDPVTGAIQIAPPCNGGVFNPFTQRSSGAPAGAAGDTGIGQCVDARTPVNAQSGFQFGLELAAQYDLADFEETLGWASGFGAIANYTWQEGELQDEFLATTSDGNSLNEIVNGTEPIPGGDPGNLMVLNPLRGISRNSFNITLFYEKYGINFRTRYSWRSDFVPANSGFDFGLPRVVGDRGQLNASLSYKLNKHFTLAFDGINLTQEDRPQFGINDQAVLLRQGITDRRFTFGIRAKY